MHVIVIGSGLMGVAVSYYLRQHGAEVTVLERREGIALETSFANGGMLTPSMSDPWNSPGIAKKILHWLGREDSPMLLRPSALPGMLFWGAQFLFQSQPERFMANLRKNARLAQYSLACLQELRERHGLHYDQLRQGTLKIFREQASFAHMTGIADVLNQLGIHSQILDRDGLETVEPVLGAVRHQLVGGILYPDDESGDAHLGCRAIAEQARLAGVQFRFFSQVRGFAHYGGPIHGVETDTGRLKADAYVLAAGSYSGPLARRLGLNLPLKPVKGYSITLPRSTWEGRLLRPIVDDDQHLCITPLGDRLRVAGSAELTGWDRTLRPGRLAPLRKELLSLLPAFKPHLREADIHPWAGLRPMCADGVPLLGATRIPNLFLCTAPGHLGWTLSTGCGRLVADLIAGKDPELPLADYQLGRFKDWLA